MRNELVTVVVPVYKTEEYLNRCIDSIINQTYIDLEILLIDDGSPDNCPQICDEWAQKDARICVIHKKNEGLGEARNTGIEHSHGKYVCFIDSDDYIDRETIEKAIKTAEKESAEIVIFGIQNVSKTGVLTSAKVPNTDKTVFREDEVKTVLLPDLIADNPNGIKSANLSMSVCCCLFLVDAINRERWMFPSEKIIISEDTYALLKLYNGINKVAVIREALYFYCENSTSLTHSYRADRFGKIKKFYDECIAICRENDYNLECVNRCGEIFLSFVIAAMKLECAYKKMTQRMKRNIHQIIDDELVQGIIAEKLLRGDAIPIKKRILVKIIQHKWYNLCCIALEIQNKLDDMKGKRKVKLEFK